MENSIYKKVMLCINLTKALRDYKVDPIKVINRIANDAKNELEADLNIAKNIATGINNPMTRNHTIIRGKSFLLEIIDNNLKKLCTLIVDDLSNTKKYFETIKKDIEASRENLIKSNAKLKINYIFKDEEKLNYYLTVLERDFINKLSSYGTGLNINIDLNKLLIVLRKGLSLVTKFDTTPIQELTKNTETMVQFIQSKEIDKAKYLDEDFMAEQLNILLMSKDGEDKKLKNDYKKVGEIIREIALSCPELETVQLDKKEVIFQLEDFIFKSLESLEQNINVLDQIITNHSNSLIKFIPDLSSEINNAFNQYLDDSISDSEYINIILNNLLIFTNMVTVDRLSRDNIFKFINELKDTVNVFLAIENLYLNMSTYTLNKQE